MDEQVQILHYNNTEVKRSRQRLLKVSWLSGYTGEDTSNTLPRVRVRAKQDMALPNTDIPLSNLQRGELWVFSVCVKKNMHPTYTDI